MLYKRFLEGESLLSVLFADNTTGLAKGFIISELITYINEEMRKIANWFRSNKMALNTAKTKYMIFRTRKQINENECQLVYNSTEIGLPTDPDLVSPIERVHNAGNEKFSNSSEYTLMSI